MSYIFTVCYCIVFDENQIPTRQSKTEVLMSPHTISTAAAIVNYAEKDLITIGTRGRTGITRMLLGSVARAVVTYAYCPVMVVK